MKNFLTWLKKSLAFSKVSFVICHSSFVICHLSFVIRQLVNVMVFFGVTDLPTLSRLNLRFLLEGKHLCYKCKKELGRFSQKFSVSDVRKFNFKLPRGMTTRDDLCADCFNKLPPAPMS